MMVSLDPFLETLRHASAAKALARWYDERPGILRLWAILPESPENGTTAVDAIRVLLLLEPSPDGDETAAAWVAHGATWSRELQERLVRAVQLECVVSPPSDTFKVEGAGTLLASLCWRDATVLEREMQTGGDPCPRAASTS